MTGPTSLRSWKFVILVSIVFLLLTGGCLHFPTSNSTSKGPSFNDQPLIFPSLDSTVDIAQEQAEAWEVDALISRIRIEFAPFAFNKSLTSSISFISGSSGNSWYLVRVELLDTGEYKVASASGDDYQQPREGAEALDIKNLNLTVNDAIRLGLAAASDNLPESIINDIDWPGSIELSRMNSYEFTGPTQWSVSFYQASTTGAFHVIIDDQSGEIVEIRNYIN